MTAFRDGAPALEVAAGPEAIREDLESRFIRFVAERRQRARRLAWRLVGGHDASADDVVQDALVRAYKGLSRFREDASLDTWFYRILVRQALKHRRRRRILELWNGELGAMMEAPAETATALIRDPYLQRRITRALDSLTRHQRHVFVLVHLEGFSVEETSSILGKRLGTVKSHLHRALVRLRAELADLAIGSDARTACTRG